MNKIDRVYYLQSGALWIVWLACMVAIGLFCASCGSVEPAPEAAAIDAVDGGAGDLVDVATDGPASDSSHENQPEAGAVDSAPGPEACARAGVRAMQTRSCGPSCSTCYWQDFAAPAPSGCVLATGELCVTDCAACP